MKLRQLLLLFALLSFATPAFAERCSMSFFNFGKMVCGKDMFWEHTYLLMHTRPGERVMRPEFGVNWDNLCFEPMTEDSITRMEAELKKKITQDVGIDVVSVDITVKEPDQPSFIVKVTYLVGGVGDGSGAVDTLEIPFNCGQ